MSNNVICIDAKFSSEQLQFWASFGVIHPKQDKVYFIREVVRHTNGKTGLLLEELVNPAVPVKHDILDIRYAEPTWNIKRFRTLDGEQINREMLQEFFRIKQSENTAHKL